MTAEAGTMRGVSNPSGEGNCASRVTKAVVDRQSDAAAERGEECSFDKELRHDVAVRGAQSLAQPNLPGSFGNRNQHDVDDANGAQAESNDSDHAKEPIHRVKNLGYANGAVDGVPVHECVVETGIETVTPGDDGVNFILGFEVQFFLYGPVVDERDGILGVLRLERKKHAHGVEGDKDAVVGAVVALFADLGDDADHFEIHVVEQDRAAHGGLSGEHVLEEFPSHDGHAAMLGVVFIIEPASGLDRSVANLVVVRELRRKPGRWWNRSR